MRKLKNCEKLIEMGIDEKDIRQRLKTKSSRNINYWIERGYDNNEAIIMSRSKIPGTIEYFKYFKGIKDDIIAKQMADDFNKAKAKTLVNFIKKYGKIDGENRWKIYCEKQSNKNTFEYKREKFGWNAEQFDKFNKSRAITLDNLVNKYGKVVGENKWKDYCDRQKYTKSKKYFLETYGIVEGEKEWKRIIKLKSHTYESYLERFNGDIEKATYEFNNFLSKRKFYKKNYSNVANEMFDKLRDKLFNTDYKEFYYNNHNQEWFVNVIGYKPIYFDFFLKNTGKVIEFYGDYWHCNPKKYKPEQNIKIGNVYKKVTDVWEHDRIRIEYMKKIPYVKDILIIWQNEYIENPDEILKKCFNFLIK